jgi:transposase
MKIKNLLRSIKKKIVYKKVIMPRRCELCGIGIGVSIQYEGNRQIRHEHIEARRYEVKVLNKNVRVCSECRNYLERLPQRKRAACMRRSYEHKTRNEI